MEDARGVDGETGLRVFLGFFIVRFGPIWVLHLCVTMVLGLEALWAFLGELKPDISLIWFKTLRPCLSQNSENTKKRK